MERSLSQVVNPALLKLWAIAKPQLRLFQEVKSVPEVRTEEEEPGTLPVDDKKMESEYLFVYGGLKRGGVYHKNALSDAEFLGEAMSRKGKYALFSPNDQWPVLFKGHYRVKGELYRINQAILNRVDWIEGHPQLFQRVLFKIK